MSGPVTLERLRHVLMRTFEVRAADVVPSARLVDDLGLDSLDAVDLVVRLEQETGLAIGEDELRSLQTVQDVVDLLDAKFRAGGGDAVRRPGAREAG